MSATRGGADPSALYVTPAWAIDAIVPHIPVNGLIVDAGCGEGAILGRLRAHNPNASSFIGVELDPARAEVARQQLQLGIADEIETADFLTWGDGFGQRVDLVAMNPSFSIAEEFLERAIHLTAKANGTVACLLRYTWPIPACRAGFVKRHPFDVGWLSRRPDFAASIKCKGNSGSPCGWKVMQRIEDPRPKECPNCHGAVSIVTTDSADYGWFLFGPGRGGRHFPLEIPERERVA